MLPRECGQESCDLSDLSKFGLSENKILSLDTELSAGINLKSRSHHRHELNFNLSQVAKSKLHNWLDKSIPWLANKLNISSAAIANQDNLLLDRELNSAVSKLQGTKLELAPTKQHLNNALEYSSKALNMVAKEVSANKYLLEFNSNRVASHLPAGKLRDRNSISDSIAPAFASFAVADASGDGTPNTVFQHGALRLDWTANIKPKQVKILAKNEANGMLIDLGNAASGGLINLHTNPLASGNYRLYAQAEDADNYRYYSPTTSMQVLEFNPANPQSFKEENIQNNVSSIAGMTAGAVLMGRGGWDILDLSKWRSDRVNFELSRRAIFGGLTWDWLKVNDTGQEVYFAGYEQLKFADKSIDLVPKTSDPAFPYQSNLKLIDALGAWKFSTGSQDILLGNVDTGILTKVSPDLTDRIRAIPGVPMQAVTTDRSYDHGSYVQGIMAANSNNNQQMAGINWQSFTYAAKIIGSNIIAADKALELISDRALKEGKRIAINNSWRDVEIDRKIEAVLRLFKYRDNSLYVFAAGNEDNSQLSWPARWAGELNNVMAVGAIDEAGKRIKTNEKSRIWNTDFVSYWGSNYGEGLSLVAPGIVPLSQLEKPGADTTTLTLFMGTSASAPQATGAASLVWSIYPVLTASEVKDILMAAAYRHFPWYNRNEYGAGILDAEIAVRRADAIKRDRTLANINGDRGLFLV